MEVPMINFMIRRLLLVPVLLFGVTVLIFAMLQFLSPIERASLYTNDIPHNDNAVESFITRYGLDDPIHLQYWNWLVGKVDPITGNRNGGILFGNFGFSQVASQPVAELIKHRFPNT